MCGIWALFLKSLSATTPVGGWSRNYYEAFKCLAPRGPDRSHLVEYNGNLNIKLGFHRLSIMDPSPRGDQPFTLEYEERDGAGVEGVEGSPRSHIVTVVCNGEIYNFRELATRYDLTLRGGSDCEVIHLLYRKIGIERLVTELRGEFAFVLVDMEVASGDMVVYACRDPFGVRPLFVSVSPTEINFSSELKGLVCVYNKGGSESDADVGSDMARCHVEPFRPGHYMVCRKRAGTWSEPTYLQYYACGHRDTVVETDLSTIKGKVVELLTQAVRCRLVADRPLGCLLSGGLDSSLVAGLSAKILAGEGRRLKTFSIGLPGGTDEKYAKMVASHIGSDHTHVSFSEKDFIEAVPEVIASIESYDITTVRASTAQYLISKWISRNTTIKVLLIGDGSDELCSGYMYFHKTPSPDHAHRENMRLLQDISCFDVLRADRGISDNGLEGRVPFLDVSFVDYYLSVDPALRVPIQGIEKWLLRESFADTGLLPREVLMRAKEGLSDACSSHKRSWFMILQEHTDRLYTDKQFHDKQKTYRHCVPPTKEALYFRELFELNFGRHVSHVIPYYWLPKWCGDITEPSARVLKVYQERQVSDKSESEAGNGA